MIKLYGMGLSNNVSKVRYCLHYLQLEYDWVQTNPLEGENQTEEYLELSPSGKIPAIEVDGLKLFESNAINRYLCTANNSSLYPNDPKKRAIIDAWMDFGAIHIASAVARVFFNRVFANIVGAEVDKNSEKAGIEFLERFIPVCDKQLDRNKYIAGEQLSLADVNLLAILDPAELMQFSLGAYGNLTAWRNQLMAEDWYQKCYANGTYSEFVQTQMAQMS